MVGEGLLQPIPHLGLEFLAVAARAMDGVAGRLRGLVGLLAHTEDLDADFAFVERTLRR